MNKQSQIRKILILLFILLSFTVGGFVFAQEDSVNREYFINLDKATIAKGYTVAAFEDILKLSLAPGILSEDTGVDVWEINESVDMPWNLDRVSKIYQFEFRNKQAYDNQKPFYIQFAYNESSDDYKQVFFYDKNYSAWRPLPTRDYPKEKFVRSLIHLPFARIVVLSNPDVLAIGKASWYAYRGGNFAASPDFPKGSKLRVYNTDNNKFVDVEINDFGPDRNLHPDRVVDLDKVAFKKIASLGAGIINVSIEALEIKPDEKGRILGSPETGAVWEPAITAKSAIVMDEDTSEVLWKKNASSTLPLASLTKLVAVKVFLDTRPSLDEVVAYSIKDEEYNYEYCNKWESARVTLNDGDTLTIEDLLYSALVGSANNAVETLARVSGLDRDDFIQKMNEEVKNWGAVSTKFIEPTGLSPENVSSAQDYAIITREVFTHPIIQKASTMEKYKFTTINTKKAHRIKNTNQIIFTNRYNVIGSKTGYLDEAGYCLMLRAENAGRKIIVVTFGAGSRDTSFAETEDLLRYGFRNL
ncbi:hypothetical protein COV49_04535 [Candidatus Falkowbacteria bacterium CG11_big_fil_rev_8_21_14_0_20_39_10]|uniref:Peptidase S11 D-alanyl-D-alanine carboxypeptidase A N-terminal domain-containing protein n=1 Tax=Candidatus Falkowbacteria bacterium CG11_big_fil_rev_8_21_14_0_20_39_10 TaxID=1974570 RepID=A0A2M6K7X1_9BACT|nr:MAG: hypothetical protein COV49_04535 [Candidatus Falkowbacteria bacterium CG11_big_fil_rev_8_21_14_0_20_39_10]